VHSTAVWLPQTQTWIHTQVSHLPRDLVESHIVCEKTENLGQFPVARLHDFSDAGPLERVWDRSLRRIGLSRHLGFLERVATRQEAHIIHSHFGDVAWSNLGAARAARCRHVVTFYGYDMSLLPRHKPWRERYRALFRDADLMLCEGPHMARCLMELGCAEAKVRVQHLGIALDRLPFKPRAWQTGQKLRVLIASTFTEKKGIPFALEALGRLRRSVDLEVTVIGDARDADPQAQREKQRILAAIQASGLAGNIRRLGYQPYSTLIEQAYEHHLFLSPSVTAEDGSTEGGAPVSIIEMAASGMLVVSTRHCDIPEVIQHRKTGFLANERDVDELTECLLSATREPQRWPQMLASARQHVETEFDARVQGARLATHYQAIAGGRTSA
jgi:colanic acid/amylovoran biosynthesis glycosyltransferase